MITKTAFVLLGAAAALIAANSLLSASGNTTVQLCDGETTVDRAGEHVDEVGVLAERVERRDGAEERLQLAREAGRQIDGEDPRVVEAEHHPAAVRQLRGEQAPELPAH